jgi:hypothetical protein
VKEILILRYIFNVDDYSGGDNDDDFVVVLHDNDKNQGDENDDGDDDDEKSSPLSLLWLEPATFDTLAHLSNRSPTSPKL